MKTYFVCTSNVDHEIVDVEAVFENEKDASNWCSKKNSSKEGWFCRYTYKVLNMLVKKETK